jgi:nucleotide-binding universal stress UspA family protein
VVQRVAARVGADLIALGTHGRRGFSRVLLGSVAEHVLRSAPACVLTVGPAAER